MAEEEERVDFFPLLFFPDPVDFPPDFPEAFGRLRASSGDLLTELPHTVVPGGVWVVLSGLDYARMRLTAESRIRRL